MRQRRNSLELLRDLLHDKALLKLSAVTALMYVVLLIIASVKESGQAYASAGLVALVLSVVFLGWIAANDDRMTAPMCCVVLFNIGICLQCIVGNNTATKLIVTMTVSVVAAVAFIFLFEQLCTVIDRFRSEYVLAALGGACLLIYLVLLVFGHEANGTKAWLVVGPVSLQLTEIAKLTAMVFMAYVFSAPGLTEWNKVIYSAVFVAVNAMFLVILNELGTFMVISMIYLLMCYLLIPSPKCVLSVFGSVVGLSGAGYGIIALLGGAAQKKYDAGEALGKLSALFLKIYDKLKLRFDLWLHLEQLDRNSTGYQTLKAKEAILVGGLFGSSYKVHVPIAASDFAYPSLILNFGLLIGIVVVLLFFLFTYEGIGIYLKVRDPFRQALCIGFVYCISVQSLLMIFGSTNFFIMTGIPIAFLSEGGTAMIATFVMVCFIFYQSFGSSSAKI